MPQHRVTGFLEAFSSSNFRRDNPSATVSWARKCGLLPSSLINIQTLEAARQSGVKRYLYTSSACIYPEYKQTDVNAVPLKEEDAYPAQPQDAYGWEKLIAEEVVHALQRDYGIETRVVEGASGIGAVRSQLRN